ncbi:MAG: hypothetical protein M3512_06980 [Bacteroidota bacterium]|nr:hypothetical protein [Bacteroidota bacterium]
MRVLILTTINMVVYAAAYSQEVFEKPIIFDETRKDLSLQYLKDRYGLKKYSQF